ncbi:hypothetical protein P368_10510 [Comamonas thiooxydans]|nr:hypothetical protein P369_09260 [Comamonas thiooxydans]KGG98520.1 hypothetical protein P367_12165 [Comamonas thiooxydans]KGH04468.1 hypothetical protein P365_12325 [Comamonas thiooxydans]KGH12978.1 hypothetical protein P368_10510 [Comamonas thiooxydans]
MFQNRGMFHAMTDRASLRTPLETFASEGRKNSFSMWHNMMFTNRGLRHVELRFFVIICKSEP